jgi:hypothetical protein
MKRRDSLSCGFARAREYPVTAQNSEKTVMPAWIAGIQVRRGASGDIHVNLGSSTPCWNDEIKLPA